ncbi:hypothetical protein Patl1_28220 [Pistacia atlantica]|uniref:Uncharacterized protein n=1 Tax=Pistacia atlantica TaxID=434234 RepID=A0ACC1BGP8_9ROSI|nr:hypothetical protein Patl1_28220 [Pistacia atlantica]
MTYKERRQFKEKGDMATWSVARVVIGGGRWIRWCMFAGSIGVCWWSVGDGDGDCIMVLGWLLVGGRMVMVVVGGFRIRVKVLV